MPDEQQPALDLPRVLSTYEFRLDDCSRVRWLGSDGGTRIGWPLPIVGSGTLAYSELTREVVNLRAGEYKLDAKKDNAGNPIEQPR